MPDMWETLFNEWRSIRKAPRTFAAVGIGAVILSWGVASRYYGERIEDLKDTVHRYEVALGTAKPSSNTSLTALNNEELKKKAEYTVRTIRDIMSLHEKYLTDIKSELTSKTLTEQQYGERSEQERGRAAKQFEKEIRADALILLDELRSRLPPEIRERNVTSSPKFRSADHPEAEVSIHRLIPSNFSVITASFLANEIEDLAKVLPDR